MRLEVSQELVGVDWVARNGLGLMERPSFKTRPVATAPGSVFVLVSRICLCHKVPLQVQSVGLQLENRKR